MNTSSTPAIEPDQYATGKLPITYDFKQEDGWISVKNSAFFSLAKDLKRELIDQEIVTNHTKSRRGKHLEANLMSCTRRSESSILRYYEDNKAHVQVMHCQSKYCFDCSEARMRRNIKDVLSYLRPIILKYKCPTAYHFVFTLPKNVQRKILENKKKENNLLTKIKRIIYQCMLSTNNVRNKNILLHKNRHVVGNNSLMNFNLHYHFVAIAGIYVETVNQKKKEYTICTNTISGHVAPETIHAINAKWKKVLQKFSNDPTINSIVKVRYANLKKSHKQNMKIVTRLFMYVGRSFGKHFATAPCFYHPEKKEVVLCSSNDGVREYKTYSFWEYLQQWIFVRDNRKARCEGILGARDRFAKVLGIQKVEDKIIPEMVDYDPAEIKRFRNKTPKNKISNRTEVYLKDETGSLRHIPPSTYEFGLRGKNKRWEVTPA
ncbi:hypothetical protein [Halodesulfovibrio marinisediminis]|uniref:Uncharacterized protein n=1 Tax=Halodesulfovibrio marinisediminis DSM 17456 TaxID=1121457 RepID=A0A1N6J5S3_9BACT|nr:hypothetical protein [Halodesulfovibrio marinisediminis]SIO39650.1 hypothetical protein SAMN02745161_3183 [Halodesulfovibrio marinisediminis DSM 17456]